MNQLVLIQRLSENGYLFSYENDYCDKWSIKIEKRTAGYSSRDTEINWYVNVLDRRLEWKEILVINPDMALQEVKETVAKILNNMKN